MKKRLLYCFIFFFVGAFLIPIECRSEDNKTSAVQSMILKEGFDYQPEHLYDTEPHPDEALVNIQVESNRWPNCNTFESTIQSIFRIEGVVAKSDEEKALALWKWCRILMSATGGGYAYEGTVPGKEILVHDSHKILTVYGHHQCDGLSWAMVPLWRAAGYIAFDEASHGHTTASLRYKDHDGKSRFHSFDLKERFFWWNPELKVVGNRTLPLMQGTVHRHLTLPQKVHSLRKSLHSNEVIEWKWLNEGHVVPSGRQSKNNKPDEYYQYRNGKTDGAYACAGTEVQRFTPDISQEGYQSDLSEGSNNVKSTHLEESINLLHPAANRQKAEAIYRISSSYAGVDATIEADVRRLTTEDTFKLYLSRDGKNWEVIYDKRDTGEAVVRIDLGRESRAKDRPHIYTAYTFYIKAEMFSQKELISVGLKKLNIIVYRMLNKRTLPNLLPGENLFKVNADSIRPGKALAISVEYQVNGKNYKAQNVISKFPYYYQINVNHAAPEIRDNYDQTFGLGEIRMVSINMWLVDFSGDEVQPPLFLMVEHAENEFIKPHPHPAGDRLMSKRDMKKTESDISQTDGFFPQYAGPDIDSREDLDRLSKLIKQFRNGDETLPETWYATETLGNFPAAIDNLLAKFTDADGDLIIFICKALSKLKNEKAIEPLLAKWKTVPEGAPGTRYIPDVLAAIGDPVVVPALVSKLKYVRFDYRFHIAHALGKLGGNLAEQTLFTLSEKDPFPAVREEAKRGLAVLEEKRRGK